MNKKLLIAIILGVFSVCALIVVGDSAAAADDTEIVDQAGEVQFEGWILPSSVGATLKETTIFVGQEVELSIEASGGQNFALNVSSKSKDDTVAITSANSRKIEGVAPGVTEVTVSVTASIPIEETCAPSTSTASIKSEDTFTITVLAAQNSNAVLKPMSLYVGMSQAVESTDLVPADAGKWSIANTNIAEVDGAGKVTAKAVGRTVLTYTEGDIKVSASVEVKALTLRFNPDKVHINEGGTARAYVSFPADYTGATDGTWRTADADVATIAAAETSNGRRFTTITAHSEGETTVTFTHTASGAQASAAVTVQSKATARRNIVTFVQRPPTLPGPVSLAPIVVDTAPVIEGPDTIYLVSNGAAYNQQYTVTGNPTPTLSLSDAAGDNTANATLVPDGTLTIPAGLAAGEYRAVLVASNTAGKSVKEVKICVVDSPGILGPDTIDLMVGYAAHSEQYTSAGTPSMLFVISGAPGENTANATLSPDGTLTIPARLAPGTYKAVLHTQNVGHVFIKPVIINVKSMALTPLAPASLPNAARLMPYAQTLSVSGGTAPYTYSITAGSLPGWLTLGGATLSGTPQNADVGQTSNFTVTATDANGHTTSSPYSITVGDSISISTPSLPNGGVGVFYSMHLETESSRGMESTGLTFGVVGGTPPPWLELFALQTSGTIQGTPTAPGTYTFTVAATTDTIPVGVPKTFTLTVQ